MIKIEKKIIKYKPFFYLTNQVNIGGSFKKIQVYIGKNIPNDLGRFYEALREKEIKLVNDNLGKIYSLNKTVTLKEFKEIESSRLRFKYYFSGLSEYKQEILWSSFAIKFIFESNAIEGSRLSQEEVEAIVKKKYLKKSTTRKEIIEVENSLKAFALIRSAGFKLNQHSIIALHDELIKGLGTAAGYKKEEIIVNNKPTVAPNKVRSGMTNLLKWWNKQSKKNIPPLITAAEFHQRFEQIHPFIDGNGRTGRLLFNWMLLKSGYGVILFKNKNRQVYFSALDQADNGRMGKLYRHCFKVYKETIWGFIK
jgi:Fic family protein